MTLMVHFFFKKYVILGAAGSTVFQLTQQNIEVFYLIVTNGDKGCANPLCANWTTSQIAVTRMQVFLKK